MIPDGGICRPSMSLVTIHSRRAARRLPGWSTDSDFTLRLTRALRDHGVDLAGKRVALIGNGSTGTQLMPHVARSAKSLTVYQRTPQWVMPVQNYRAKVSPEVNWLFNNVPNYWNWHCFSSFKSL